MLFDNMSFHYSAIISVVEDAFTQTFDFLLNFPTDWKNNIYEKKILRFSGVVFYLKKEIPFIGYPAILEIKLSDKNRHTWNFLEGTVSFLEYKAEISTNAGPRIIEFEDAKFPGQ